MKVQIFDQFVIELRTWNLDCDRYLDWERLKNSNTRNIPSFSEYKNFLDNTSNLIFFPRFSFIYSDQEYLLNISTEYRVFGLTVSSNVVYVSLCLSDTWLPLSITTEETNSIISQFKLVTKMKKDIELPWFTNPE